MAEISVIVPIYNSSQYLDRCIQSLLSQSFTNYELIIIDDGSKDDSYVIAKRYADSDSRIVLVKQENSGVSSARNHGLDLATGRYVCFVDSDDYVCIDYLEQLYSMIDSKTELVFSGMEYFHAGVVNIRILQKDHCWDLDKESDFIDFLYQPLQSSPCSKLYLRDIISENSIRFDTTLFCAEDRDFNLRYFDHIDRAVSISYSGYCYRRDVVGSLTKRSNPDAFKNRCIHWGMRRAMCTKRQFESKRTQARLANDLYSNVNNEFIRISKSVGSYREALTSCRKRMSFVDFGFLKTWREYIDAPKWQLFLVVYNLYSILLIIYRIYLYGKAKG